MPAKMRLQVIALGCLSASVSTAVPCRAQTGAPELRQRFETRATLQAQLKAADSSHNTAASYMIKYRLEHGDFYPGDRIFVRVEQGATGFADTLVVREGKRLDLPQMGDVSLDGVLRSELETSLSAYMGKYLRSPNVKATPLIRLAIIGAVGRPGFFYTPADLPLPDILMRAGGPGPDADLANVTVRREGDVIIDQPNTATAIREGMSADMLNLQGGDEIEVGRQSHTNWGMFIPIGTTVAGLLFTYFMRR
jgi:protein involved in polysaccharide export with SLBB domain